MVKEEVSFGAWVGAQLELSWVRKARGRAADKVDNEHQQSLPSESKRNAVKKHR
jgi:hypothetical protein